LIIALVVGRDELTDKAWARIEPLLPPVAAGTGGITGR
jgi:transposase